MSLPTVWHDARYARAKTLREQGMDWFKIDEALGLKRGSTAAKFRRYRAAGRSHPTHNHIRFGVGEKCVVPPDVLAERDARLCALESRSQTAELFGDPAPGFSALDRRG